MKGKLQDVATNASEHLPMFILDVLRHDDFEQVSSILKLLNENSGTIGWRDQWPHDFTKDEVLPSIEALVQARQVSLWREDAAQGLKEVDPRSVNVRKEVDGLWFGLSAKGREAWDAWEPPVSDEDEA